MYNIDFSHFIEHDFFNIRSILQKNQVNLFINDLIKGKSQDIH
jgi:hypothetical protein